MSIDSSARPDAVAAPGREVPDREERGARSSLMNQLRAGVLGANDGIVSVAAMVMGVAGATTDSFAILVAGVAGLSAGALSMGVGEFVSVSAQRDSERALLARSRATLGDRAEEVLGLDPDHLVNPWHAAWASMGSFVLGALVPLLVMVLTAPDARVLATGGAVVLALVLTGVVSAKVGEAPVGRAVARVVAGGVVAMAITYAIGMALGGSVA
ncbi:MAG: VIT1/CCC1 transporter family protein [Propionibacteriaceae bacterium]|nr:VIT1/CCC1 transporter family protein [Propionibacteriaceae bacterium]